MKMQNMNENVRQSDHAGPTLKRVSPVVGISVLIAVGFARLGDPNPDGRMKDQG